MTTALTDEITSEKQIKKDSAALIKWYLSIRRELPWRSSQDPYRIWVSEVMLQQTTVAAVVPYYERFMTRFPSLASLATSSIEDVLENWAGLGYYSRARNLHKSAQALHLKGFPRTTNELLELPGFGPYTARAVASLAFNEKTGVLDGNVIRVLSRRYGLKLQWWKPAGRAPLQELADRLAQVDAPADLNQGLMELGATVCTPQSPACILCPWVKVCVARATDQITELPNKKPRRARESWRWNPTVVEQNGSILLVPNTYAPFLKGHWILPGSAERLEEAPAKFDYRGSVTHHDIFVVVSRETKPSTSEKKLSPKKHGFPQAAAGKPEVDTKWVSLKLLEREIPASLIRKAIHNAARK